MFVKITTSCYSLGSCGRCQTNYVACHSESTFSLCIGGIPSDTMITCPVDRVCTGEPVICVSKPTNSVRPTCITGCGVCSSYRQVFSCIGPNKFAFCFGEADPFYEMTGNCLYGYICDLSSQTICVKSTDGIKPSCNEDYMVVTTTNNPSVTSSPGDGSSSTTEDPSRISSSTTQDPPEIDNTITTTVEISTRTPRDAATFCAETTVPGAYKAEGDSTCTKYYMCTEEYGVPVLQGTEGTCPDFFDSEKRECQEVRPADC